MMVVVSGLFELYRFRKWLGLTALLWIVAGLAFQQSADWRTYLWQGRVSPFSRPAYHAVSRLARQAEQKPHIVGLPYHRDTLEIGTMPFTQRGFYFEQYDTNVHLTLNVDADALEYYLRWDAKFESSLWLFYRSSIVDSEHVKLLDNVVRELDYQLCSTVNVGADTVVRQYAWVSLGCAARRHGDRFRSENLDYFLYGVKLGEVDSRLYFSDMWRDRVASTLDNLRLSHQLIGPERDNVAQLDLPLVHEGKPRQFYIDVAGVAAGSYRLMVILYNKNTGKRLPWIDNDGELPYMLTLAEVEIPDEN